MDERTKRNKVGRIVGTALLLGGLAVGTLAEQASANRPSTVKGRATCTVATGTSHRALRVTVIPDRMNNRSWSAKPGFNGNYAVGVPTSGMYATVAILCPSKISPGQPGATHYRRILIRPGNSNHDFVGLR